MSDQSTDIKAFQDKVSAQLQQAKAKIEEIQAQAKGKMAQTEVDAINGFHAKRQEIEKKSQDLKTAGDAKAAQARSEIESDTAKLKTSVDQFITKVKAQTASS